MSATRRRWPGLPTRPRGQKVTAQQARQMWQRAPVTAAPGLPIGTDPRTGSPVSGDPVTWARAGLLPRNRLVTVGPADSILQRWVLGSTALGVRPVVLDGGSRLTDTVNALGGQVLQFGRGADSLNVLENPAHRLAVTSSLLLAATGVMPTVGEQRLLAAAIGTLPTDSAQPQAPMLWDLIAALQKQPEAQGVVQTLQSIVHHYGDVIARPTTVRVDPQAPAVSLSIVGVNPKDGFLRAALQVALWSAAAEYTQTHDCLTVTHPGEVLQAMPGMLDELQAMLAGSVAVVLRVTSEREAAETGCPVQVRADSGEFEVRMPGRTNIRTRLNQTSTEADIAAGLVSSPQPSLWPPVEADASNIDTSETDAADGTDWLAAAGEPADAAWSPLSETSATPADVLETPDAEAEPVEDQAPVLAQSDLDQIEPDADGTSPTEADDSLPAEAAVGPHDADPDDLAQTDVLAQSDLDQIEPDADGTSPTEADDSLPAEAAVGPHDADPDGLAQSDVLASTDPLEGLHSSDPEQSAVAASLLSPVAPSSVIPPAVAVQPADAVPSDSLDHDEAPVADTDDRAGAEQREAVDPMGSPLPETEAEVVVPAEEDPASPGDPDADALTNDLPDSADTADYDPTILSTALIPEIAPGGKPEAFNDLDDEMAALQSVGMDGGAAQNVSEAAMVDPDATPDHQETSNDIDPEDVARADGASAEQPVEAVAPESEVQVVQEQLWLWPPPEDEPGSPWSSGEDLTDSTTTPALTETADPRVEMSGAGLVSLFDVDAAVVDDEPVPEDPSLSGAGGVSVAGEGLGSAADDATVEPITGESEPDRAGVDEGAHPGTDSTQVAATEPDPGLHTQPPESGPGEDTGQQPDEYQQNQGAAHDHHDAERVEASVSADDPSPQQTEPIAEPIQANDPVGEAAATAPHDNAPEQQPGGSGHTDADATPDQEHVAEESGVVTADSTPEDTPAPNPEQPDSDDTEPGQHVDDAKSASFQASPDSLDDAALRPEAASLAHRAQSDQATSPETLDASTTVSDGSSDAGPATSSKRPVILLGVAAAAVVAVAAVWAQTGTDAPAVVSLNASSGGQAAAAVSAPSLPGGSLAPGADLPAGAGGVLAAERRAPATRPGGSSVVAGSPPPPAPGAVLVAASTAARPLPAFGIARVAWTGAADWQKAQQPVIITQLPISVPGTTVTVPQPLQPANPQVAPPQSGQSDSTGTGTASGGNGGGAQPAPGAPPPNQPFNPQNPDSPS